MRGAEFIQRIKAKERVLCPRCGQMAWATDGVADEHVLPMPDGLRSEADIVVCTEASAKQFREEHGGWYE